MIEGLEDLGPLYRGLEGRQRRQLEGEESPDPDEHEREHEPESRPAKAVGGGGGRTGEPGAQEAPGRPRQSVPEHRERQDTGERDRGPEKRVFGLREQHRR